MANADETKNWVQSWQGWWNRWQIHAA